MTWEFMFQLCILSFVATFCAILFVLAVKGK